MRTRSTSATFHSPERRRLFDINDFDETLAGPWDWDVKRLAASIEVAALDPRFDEDARRRAVLACVRQHREQMNSFAAQSNLEVWYARLDVEAFGRRLSHAKHRADAKKIQRNLREGLKRNHLTAFSKLIESTGGEPRFVHRPRLIVPIAGLLDDDGWRRYVDVMRQFLVATGAASAPTCGTSSTSTAACIWRARSSAWAVSGPALGWCSRSGATAPIR